MLKAALIVGGLTALAPLTAQAQSWQSPLAGAAPWLSARMAAVSPTAAPIRRIRWCA